MDVWNTFNLKFWIAIFQGLWSCTDILDKLFLIIRHFYIHPSPLHFSKAFRHMDLTIISSKSGTQHEDPLERVLFALIHLHVLRLIAATHLLGLAGRRFWKWQSLVVLTSGKVGDIAVLMGNVVIAEAILKPIPRAASACLVDSSLDTTAATRCGASKQQWVCSWPLPDQFPECLEYEVGII
jgi:hypothetical protein